MNYLVIDLEMCKVPKTYRGSGYKYASETIQIGAVLLDEAYQAIGTMSQYVHPEHGVLDKFIADLTGIDNANIKNAPLLEEVLRHMCDWIGNREYKIFAWSGSDYLQLAHEIRSKKIEDPAIDEFMNAEHWIDYQKTFDERYEFRHPVGLEEALMLCDIQPEGRFHDGLCDAVNTAKLIRMLELNPDFHVENYEKEAVEKSETLNFTLGDLLAGLGLKVSA